MFYTSTHTHTNKQQEENTLSSLGCGWGWLDFICMWREYFVGICLCMDDGVWIGNEWLRLLWDSLPCFWDLGIAIIIFSVVFFFVIFFSCVVRAYIGVISFCVQDFIYIHFSITPICLYKNWGFFFPGRRFGWDEGSIGVPNLCVLRKRGFFFTSTSLILDEMKSFFLYDFLCFVTSHFKIIKRTMMSSGRGFVYMYKVRLGID